MIIKKTVILIVISTRYKVGTGTEIDAPQKFKVQNLRWHESCLEQATTIFNIRRSFSPP